MCSRLKLKLSVFLVGFSAFVTFSSVAKAQSHSMINDNRSSLSKNIFVTQGIEGEYGRVIKVTAPGGDVASSKTDQTWRGYGIRNGIGIELFKFTQFAFSHTLVNLRSKDNSLESLNGSRLSAALRLVFSSPVGNIEFGSGIMASQLDYQNVSERAVFFGTGHFYSLGLNYFVSQSISVFTNARQSNDFMKQSSGSNSVETIKSNIDGIGIGVKIWL